MNEEQQRYLLGDKQLTKPFRTRVKIVDATVDLMEETDFDRIRVIDIVECAGISRSTFYVYFKDPVDVVEQLEEALISHMPFYSSHDNQSRPTMGSGDLPSHERCQRLPWVEKWFDYTTCFKREFSALLGPHGDESFTHRIQSFLRSSYTLQMNDDAIRNDELRTYHIKACTELQLILLNNWLKDGRRAELTSKELADVLNLVRVGGLYAHYLVSHPE